MTPPPLANAPLTSTITLNNPVSPSVQPTLTWTFASTAQPMPPTSVGALLLNAANSLLQNCYIYSGPNDFWPESYTGMALTSYVIGTIHPCKVSWPPITNQQIVWESAPANIPGVSQGWGSIVTQAGIATTATNTQCNTDCSGFITSLFTYVNNQQSSAVTTAFTGWQLNQSIPEAGCFDPGTGGCSQPNPSNYYSYFIQSTNGFEPVPFDQLSPGDIIAWANNFTPPGAATPTDTGHIMLVVAVANAPLDTSGQTKWVVVIDESGNPGHSCDSREATSQGLGIGIIALSQISENNIQFFWDCGTTSHQIGPVAFGRAAIMPA